MDLPVETILTAAAPVFALLILGFLLRRWGVISQEADRSLMQLVIKVFYPCLFLNFIIGNEALYSAKNLILPPLVGFVTIVVGFIVGRTVAKMAGLERGKGLRTFAFCSGIYNYGYIPIPLIAVLFGDKETGGVLLVHNVGVEVAIWTVGIIMLGGSFTGGLWKKLINPPLIAMCVGLSVNFSGAAPLIPSWVSNLIAMLGACSIPIGILLAGASIADLTKESDVFKEWKIPSFAILVRLIVLPAVFILIALLLPWASDELKRVIVIQAAMPAGILPIVLARHYGGETSVAIKVVVSTTIFSVITMPLWIGVGLWAVF